MTKFHIVKTGRPHGHVYELIGFGHCGNGNDALYYTGDSLIETIKECFLRNQNYGYRLQNFYLDDKNRLVFEYGD
jgi:hypothetical protein